ncbi:MAG: heavy metal translocating P-type ATPase metal-binding domain-containing protein [Burkholderiales bacterium]
MTAATPDSAAKHPAADFDVGCFHCGLPLEAAVFPVRIEGVEHGTCCRVCQAVAQTIADKGAGRLLPQPYCSATVGAWHGSGAG